VHNQHTRHRSVIFFYCCILYIPSVLWRCWLGGRKGIRPVNNWVLGWLGAGVVVCLDRGADLHMTQLMPLPLTVSCFSKIQIGFTFLVSAHPGSPGKRAVKRVCVCACVRACVCVCVCMQHLIYFLSFAGLGLLVTVAYRSAMPMNCLPFLQDYYLIGLLQATVEGLFNSRS